MLPYGYSWAQYPMYYQPPPVVAGSPAPEVTKEDVAENLPIEEANLDPPKDETEGLEHV